MPPKSEVLDSVRAEIYESPDPHFVGPYPFKGVAGCGLTGAKTLYSSVTRMPHDKP